MSVSNLIFTVVPAWQATNSPRATVLVTPRLLTSDGRTSMELREFDFRVNWPQVLESTSLSVSYNGGGLVPVQLAPPTRPVEARDPALWRALFPQDRTVKPFVFDDDQGRTIRSFPAANVAQTLLGIYKYVAVNSTAQFPPVGVQVNADSYPVVVHPVDQLIAVMTTATDQLDVSAFRPEENQIIGNLPENIRPMYQALRFYRRRPRVGPNDLPTPPITPPDFDFHQIVALLADHPTLLRKLGLVFDVILPAPPPVASGTIAFSCPWRGTNPGDRYPLTHFEWSGGRFLPTSQLPSYVNRGYLRLDQPQFPVMQLDVDGTVLKVADFSTAARRLLTDPDRAPISETSLPALRTGGFTLMHNDRAGWLQQLIYLQANANSHLGGTVDLYAENLIRGYRIDVEVDGQWRSLCRRFGTINVGGAGTVSIPETQEEEGFVKAASAARGTYDPNEMYFHDAIAGWNGYSLVARPPGDSIVFEANRHPNEQHLPVANVPASGQKVDIAAEYKATRRSLPKLRFGKSYRFRVRLVDVTGGGLPFTDTDTGAASPPIVYGRFEPVPPPVLAQRTPITEAESLEHMVIRSTPGLTPAQYAASLPGSGYAADNHRHVLPPKASLQQIETHGLLDGALPSRSAAAFHFNLAKREAGNIGDRTIVDLDTGGERQVANMQLRDAKGALPWPNPPLPRGTPLGEGQYVLHTGDWVEMSYLPDPMCAGLVVWDTNPGATDVGPVLIKTIFGDASGSFSWARTRQSLRLELSGSTDGQVHREWTNSGDDRRIVRIKLPPGQKLTLRYASQMYESNLGHMALWGMLSDSERQSVLPAFRDGKMWMLTPAREVTLVHAVQKPVAPARFAAGSLVSRVAGSTVATFQASIDCHSYSTGHIDVRASWPEIIDLPQDPGGPRVEQRNAEVFRVPVNYGANNVSTTQSTQTLRRIPTTSLAVNGVRHKLLKPLPNPAETRPGRHELGDTRFRSVTYNPVSTTRYQEYFPAAIIAERSNLETPGTPFVVDLASTAPPEAPRVAQVIPTFRWVDEADGSRKRVGGGVRIYLERPWFSSGGGERLAVIVPRSTSLTDAEKTLVSQWGRDPAWTRPSPTPLSVASFEIPSGETVLQLGSTQEVARVAVVSNEAIPDTALQAHMIVVVPEYSAERGLWFADVDLRASGTYFPFLSLALARFQPGALPGARLSRIVRAEFVQLAPDRSASVVVNSAGIDVKVAGVSAGNAFEALGGNSPYPPADPWQAWSWGLLPAYATKPGAAHRVLARLEKRDPALGDLGWERIDEKELVGNQTGDQVTWMASITRPTLESGAEYRVVITESEMYAADPPGISVYMGNQAMTGARYADGGERVVYVEIKNVF